ncbi:MAG: hypothetical protein ABWY50_03390 [Aeromicrobium sp.]
MPTRTLALAALTLALLSGCGDDETAPEADDSSTYDSEQQHSDVNLGPAEDFNAEIELPDGRKVSMYYAQDTGLAEQHYSPEADAWTAPQILYPTKTEPCSGITLEEQDGTVAVIADWALYCYDGEPPNESVAGVATGDLTDWETDLTEGFDGWTSVTLSDGGDQAVWKYHSDNRLTWTAGDGFDKQLAD